jgi:hypothetical protein
MMGYMGRHNSIIQTTINGFDFQWRRREIFGTLFGQLWGPKGRAKLTPHFVYFRK